MGDSETRGRVDGEPTDDAASRISAIQAAIDRMTKAQEECDKSMEECDRDGDQEGWRFWTLMREITRSMGVSARVAIVILIRIDELEDSLKHD